MTPSPRINVLVVIWTSVGASYFCELRQALIGVLGLWTVSLGPELWPGRVLCPWG